MKKANSLLLLILAVAALIRFYFSLGHDLWHEEAFCAWLGDKAFPELIQTLNQSGVRPPLYYWILQLWSQISQDQVWLRTLSVLLTTLSVWIVYRTSCRLFNSKIGLGAAGLVALSPILVLSAGSEVSPISLDLLLGALIFHTFIRSLTLSKMGSWVFHGLTLGAGAYCNPYLLSLMIPEGLFFLFFKKRRNGLFLRWCLSAAIGVCLFIPWAPLVSDQLTQSPGHDDLITQDLDLRLNCLLVELCMGRLYAWSPLTPVFSLAPTSKETPGPEKTGSSLEWMQALQMAFLGCFLMLALVGCVAGMRINAWPVPAHQRVRSIAMKALRKKLEDSGQSPEGLPINTIPGKEGVFLLFLAFTAPFLFAMGSYVFMDWTFDGSRLIFISTFLLILVARGVGAMEWKVMYYGFLCLILAFNLFYITLSKGLGELTTGVKEAGLYLKNGCDIEEGDFIVHENPLTFFPLLPFHREWDRSLIASGPVSPVFGGEFLTSDQWKASFQEGFKGKRIWWVSLTLDDPRLDAMARRTDWDEELLRNPGKGWIGEETKTFGNIGVTLYKKSELR